MLAGLLALCLTPGCLTDSPGGPIVDEDGRRLQLDVSEREVDRAGFVAATVTLEGAPWKGGARVELRLDGELRASAVGDGPSWTMEVLVRDERDDGTRQLTARAVPLEEGSSPLESDGLELRVDVPSGGTLVDETLLYHPCWPRTLHVEGERAILAGQFGDVVRGDSCVLIHEPAAGWIDFPRQAPLPYGPVVGIRSATDETAPWAADAHVVEAFVHASVQNILEDSRVLRFVWSSAVDPESGSPFLELTDLNLGDARVPERVWFADDGDARVVGWGRDDPASDGPYRGLLARVARDGEVRWNRSWPGSTPDGGEVIFFGAAPLEGGDVATLARAEGVYEVLVWSSDGELLERVEVPGVTEILEPGGFAATPDGAVFAVSGEIAPMFADDTELELVFDREGSVYGATRPSRDRTTARGVAIHADTVVFLRAHGCELGDFDIGELVDCTLEVDARALDGTPRWTRSFPTLADTDLGARGGDNGATMFVDREGYVWLAASAHLPEPIEGFTTGIVWLAKLHP